MRGPDRDPAVTFWDPGPETEWIYQRLSAVAKNANSHNWRFELARFEHLQGRRAWIVAADS